VGKKRCPHCGAYYNNSTKPVTKRVKAHPGLGPLHYTVISYIVKYILFSILFAFGWCCIMYFFMDVTFVDERKYVYVILWGFWLIWLFFWALGKVKDVFKTRAKNAMPGLSVTCAMCGIQLPRNHRFCPDCGTVIFAHHSDSDVITEEEAKNEKLSHKAARKARKGKAKEDDEATVSKKSTSSSRRSKASRAPKSSASSSGSSRMSVRRQRH
jgi:ribosomal protein S27AE